MKKITCAPGGIAVIVVIALLAAAGFFWRSNKGNDVKFRTEKVVRGDITSTVTASGTVNAVTTVLVGTQVSGTVKEIFVDFNSAVKKNQIIAQIDPATFEAQVEQARAGLLLAKANLERSEASLADAQRSMNRSKELFLKNLIARSDLDSAETNFLTARAQVTASKAQVAQAEATLKTAETNMRYTRIISPVDGTVVSRNVDVGQTVAASFQTPTLFTIAQDLTKMQIDTNVDEADIGRIKTDMDVDFTVDAYPETTFKGKVFQVRNAPISVQNVVTYDVVIKLSNPDLKLKPGMTANVSIITSTHGNVLKLPKAALRFSPGTPDKTKAGKQQRGPGVWVVENKSPKRIGVTIGISDGMHSELLSDDLKEGQEVIVESFGKANEKPAAAAPKMF
ncbi:MAG: efflux RND transporter periplasmic adaptor subunit [Nitrospirae bacterium]|nr:efflux RND transporter periplasmic adaptor subunit [Nitrospirota bacterium]